jgi:hypothetical protein
MQRTKSLASGLRLPALRISVCFSASACSNPLGHCSRRSGCDCSRLSAMAPRQSDNGDSSLAAANPVAWAQWGLSYAVVASVAATLCYNFFFMPRWARGRFPIRRIGSRCLSFSASVDLGDICGHVPNPPKDRGSRLHEFRRCRSQTLHGSRIVAKPVSGNLRLDTHSTRCHYRVRYRSEYSPSSSASGSVRVDSGTAKSVE